MTISSLRSPLQSRLLGQIEKLFAVPAHSLLYAESFCSTEQFAAEWFDGLNLLPFDSEEAVADQNAKTERKFHSVVETKGPGRTGQFLDGNRFEGIQRIEQLFDRGSGVLIDSELFPEMRIGRHIGILLGFDDLAESQSQTDKKAGGNRGQQFAKHPCLVGRYRLCWRLTRDVMPRIST